MQFRDHINPPPTQEEAEITDEAMMMDEEEDDTENFIRMMEQKEQQWERERAKREMMEFGNAAEESDRDDDDEEEQEEGERIARDATLKWISEHTIEEKPAKQPQPAVAEVDPTVYREEPRVKIPSGLSTTTPAMFQPQLISVVKEKMPPNVVSPPQMPVNKRLASSPSRGMETREEDQDQDQEMPMPMFSGSMVGRAGVPPPIKKASRFAQERAAAKQNK